MEINVKNLTFTLYCVCGEGDNQGVSRLVLTGCGLPCLKYSESFAKIRDDAFTFESLRTKSCLNAPYR